MIRKQLLGMTEDQSLFEKLQKSKQLEEKMKEGEK